MMRWALSAVALVMMNLAFVAAAPAQEPRTEREAIDLASKLWKENRLAEAEQAFELAARLNPKDASPLQMLATMLQFNAPLGSMGGMGALPKFPSDTEQLARIEKIAGILRRALPIDDERATALRMLAHFLLNEAGPHMNDPRFAPYRAEAEALFRKLLTLDPNELETLRSLSSIDLRKAVQAKDQAAADEGIAFVQRQMQLDPVDDTAMRTLASLYDAKGDSAAAKEWRAKANELLQSRKEAESNPAFGSFTCPGNFMSRHTPRITVDPKVQAAKLKTKPAAVASQSGRVRFAVNIDLTGRVCTARLLSGESAVVPAALEALKQYVYETTFLNQQGVRVDTEVEVDVTAR